MSITSESLTWLNQQPPRGRILSLSWERCFYFCKYLLLSALLLAQAFITIPLNAEWGRTAEDYIRLPLHADAHICSDGNGGCWAAAGPVGLSHVDRDGNLTWGDEPFSVYPGPGNNPKPMLTANGDVIIAMDIYNENTGLTGVYLQRVNLDQELLWGEDGIPLDTCQRNHGIIGAYKGPIPNTHLLHWGRYNSEYHIQLINDNGESLWGYGGVELNWPHPNTNFAKTSDQCIIAAQNVSPNPTVAIVKINAEGEQLWDSRFSTLWKDLKLRNFCDAESDREGGVILVYEYERYESVEDSIRYFGINAVRVSDDGDSLWTRQVYEREKEYRFEPFGQIDPIINYAGS